jgi:hypothetical protein
MVDFYHDLLYNTLKRGILMITATLAEYKKGWFIGNFEPSLLKTSDFEIAVIHHNVGDIITPHYQNVATEYNVLISGKMTVNGKTIYANDIFIFEPLEICNVVINEPSIVVCVKTPSLGISDKVEVES